MPAAFLIQIEHILMKVSYMAQTVLYQIIQKPIYPLIHYTLIALHKYNFGRKHGKEKIKICLISQTEKAGIPKQKWALPCAVWKMRAYYIKSIIWATISTGPDYINGHIDSMIVLWGDSLTQKFLWEEANINSYDSMQAFLEWERLVAFPYWTLLATFLN